MFYLKITINWVKVVIRKVINASADKLEFPLSRSFWLVTRSLKITDIMELIKSLDVSASAEMKQYISRSLKSKYFSSIQLIFTNFN